MEPQTRASGGARVQPPDRAGATGFDGALPDLRPVRFLPGDDALGIAGPEGEERRPWSSVRAVKVGLVDVDGRAVAVTRISFDTGGSLDLTPRDAPAVVHAPDSFGEEYGPLVRVERMRLLTSVVVTAAGLGEEGDGRFSRDAPALPERPVDALPRRLPRWAPPCLVALSYVALIALGLSPASALAALIILYVHETAHAVAMRLGGVEVRGVVFIPLIGAGTVPEHAFTSRWHEVGVALAGPLTALPVTAAIVFLLRQGLLGPETGGDALRWALGVNLLNLLPVMPMDGGRVWNAVALELPRRIRAVVAFVPTVVAALLLPFTSGVLSVLLIVFLAVSVLSTRALLKRAARQQWIEDEGLDRTRLRAALREVNHALVGRARDDIDGGIPPARLGAGRAMLALVGYLAEIVLLAATLFVVIALFPHLFGGGGG